MKDNVEKEFWIVFGTLPEGDQALLKNYWQDGPLFRVSDASLMLGICVVDVAATTGRIFLFRRSKLENCSKACLKHIIAHELAHAYVFARDRTDVTEYLNDPCGYQMNEAKANLVAETWGYGGPDKVREEAYSLLSDGLRTNLRSWLPTGRF